MLKHLQYHLGGQVRIGHVIRVILNQGETFFFSLTRISTISSSTLLLAVNQLLSEKLDSLTAIPKTLANDFWTKVTLPILWTFSVVRFSAIKANNPGTRNGFFYGRLFYNN